VPAQAKACGYKRLIAAIGAPPNIRTALDFASEEMMNV
jgi:hypothetical protein